MVNDNNLLQANPNFIPPAVPNGQQCLVYLDLTDFMRAYVEACERMYKLGVRAGESHTSNAVNGHEENLKAADAISQ